MTRLHHRFDGPEDAPVLVLGPSLGTTLDLWEPQLPDLTATWRVLRYDLPGHGGSRTFHGTVSDFAGAVAELLGVLGLEKVAYAGVSLGGAVGTTLALEHPNRVASLVLCCTSARFGPPSGWHERAARVRSEGLEPLADMLVGRWFTAGHTATREARAMLTSVDPEGYAACCEALAAFDVRDRLGEVSAPSLVIAGAEDVATPLEHAETLAKGIPGAELVIVPGAAHLANLERPGAVTHAMLRHLERSTLERHDAMSDGMKVRREVLGDAHVDRAEARKTDFTEDFQDFITRYAWGEIWTRPTLDRRTRSCVTLTALVAGGHLEELAMHIRAAVRNGLSADEIKEVLLQSAVYCGVPAANSAFAIAQRVLIEDGVITERQ
jgi:3-oxoadipate enol-lactonase/4-carboxymuconolactone decarboxylase